MLQKKIFVLEILIFFVIRNSYSDTYLFEISFVLGATQIHLFVPLENSTKGSDEVCNLVNKSGVADEINTLADEQDNVKINL